MKDATLRHQISVAGCGPAGLAAGLALAALGMDVAVVGPRPRVRGEAADKRTAALFTGSIELLKNLSVWDRVAAFSEPVRAIRLVDDRDALLKAPTVNFTAEEIGLAAFGYNVPNAPLVEALLDLVENGGSRIRLIETAAITRAEAAGTVVRLHLAEGGVVESDLVAAADGRSSVCRAAAGIETRSWTYPQSALVCSFSHTRSHEGISTELHRDPGPCTIVPLPGLSSSLVWMDRPEEVRGLADLDIAAFRIELRRRFGDLLGDIQDIGPRAAFPLSGLSATRLGARRIALVGEAGHVIPPIGAQGLNLGLRDGAALADVVADALAEGRDFGGDLVLDRFHEARAPDITSRIWTVDLLNRSLISGHLPVHLARGAGILALKALPPLRRLVVREGLQPSFAEPRLMRPGGRELLVSAASPAKARGTNVSPSAMSA